LENILVSIITVSHNSALTISDTVKSVLNQTYPHIEYIIIDGASTDGTIDVINSFGNAISKFVTEPDKGIYDAINKGIRLSSGEIIGILNSDDFFYDGNVIASVVHTFLNNDIDAVIGDVLFVDPVNSSKVVRYYSSKHFNINKFKFGFMPPHPSFYVRRDLYEKFGYYKTDYKIAADFELVLRFLRIYNISYKYLEMPFVSMRSGGVSNKSISSNLTLNKEIARACRENGIITNYLLIYSKYFTKIFQFFGKRLKN
jgi:glycosyltransferase involved in cell wall biosynthesis